MSKDAKRPIIIVKKVKKGHAAHHGGSWKVAYADFVTAMMAFFMVLWILGMDESTRKAIEIYFQSPVGVHKDGYALGTSPLTTGGSPAAAAPTLRLAARASETAQFRELGDRIRANLEGPDGLGSIAAQVEIVVTEEGLRIELIEGGDGELFFAFGSAVLKPAASRALGVIAAELAAVQHPVVVEGHTDAAPFGSERGYSNWELSADRANAARRSMQGAGLGAGRIREIRGHADRHLRVPESPLDKTNRRISVLLPFVTSADSLFAAPGTESAPAT